MTDKTRRSVIARASAELLVVILGVVIGLAVDRWVAGLDDRAQADTWTGQLAEDLARDSVVVATLVGNYHRHAAFGLEALRLMDGTGVPSDPHAFIGGLEFLAWWVRFDASRDTWDEIMATGQLGVFRDDEVRSALTSYYGRLDYISALEDRWDRIFGYYWTLEQGVIPPLVRLGVVDATLGIDSSHVATPAEAAAVLEAFRRDPALQGALTTAIQTYRYGAPVLAGC